MPLPVACSLSSESAAVPAQMPLKISPLQEATLSVTHSLPSAGAPSASSSSGVSRTSSASMTFAPGTSATRAVNQPSPTSLVADPQVKGIAHGQRVSPAPLAIVHPVSQTTDRAAARRRRRVFHGRNLRITSSWRAATAEGRATRSSSRPIAARPLRITRSRRSPPPNAQPTSISPRAWTGWEELVGSSPCRYRYELLRRRRECRR